MVGHGLIALLSMLTVAVVIAAAGMAQRKLKCGADEQQSTFRVIARLQSFRRSAAAHAISPRDLLAPLLLALGSNSAGVAALYASLRAVGLHPGTGPLIQMRAAGTLSALAVPLLHGSGAVEGSMTLALHHSGAPAGAALAGAILFRLLQI